MSPLSQAELQDLFQEPMDLEEIYAEAIQAWDDCPSPDPVDRTIAFFIRLYLQDDILAKVDRASMLNSLEVRAPFLDIEFVDFVRRLPASFKLRGNTTKWILKRAAERLLPKEVIYRRKQGFAVPIGRWFTEDQLPMYGAPAAGQFWQARLDEHRQGKADHRLSLWSNFILSQTLPS
jgi:asparagine synthase (glutamine-hydrolysing)